MADIGVLYTARELSMHVNGPKDMCDLSTLQEHGNQGSLEREEAKEFFEKGLFIGKSLVEQHLIDAARCYIDNNYTTWMKKSRRQDDWRIHLMLNFEDLAENPVEHAPVLRLLLESPKVLQKLYGLMGCAPCGTFYNQIAYRTPLAFQPRGNAVPLDYQAGAEYHIDGNCNAEGTRFPDPFTVLIGVALVDVTTEDKGNFTVFPGAHASRDWSNYPAEKCAKALPSLGEAHKVCLGVGDVFFAHSLLPHRGGKNVLTKEEIESNHTIPILDENGENIIKHIQPGTREIAIFRIRGRGIVYDDDRGKSVLTDPWVEHRPVLDLLEVMP